MNLFGRNKKSERYLHGLSKGDHVVRWDHIVVYPIQVHGIVLSASDDVVTIVDFGLTAATTAQSSSSSPSRNEQETVGSSTSPLLQHEHLNGDTGTGSGNDNDNTNSVQNSNDTPLEDMINHEDRAMMKTCEKHRHEIMGPDRINILVLTEEKEIKSWKKVEYSIEKKKKGKFNWWWDNNNNKNDIENAGKNKKESKVVVEKESDPENAGKNKEESNVVDQKECDPKNEMEISTADLISEKADDTIKENDSHDESSKHNSDSKAATILLSEEIQPPKPCTENLGKEIEDDNNNDNNEEKDEGPHTHSAKKAKKESPANTDKEVPEPLLTRSDPATIVLARVRYLISNPHVLPAHHIFYSNSECIAVWCKTGVWSTFQASIYLHSTAAGNFKSAVTAAAAVGGSTVTTTVPASGIGGWFGLTTTSTVSLISVQPWLIPALAGYGIIAVGGPYIILRKCQEQWRKATQELNDKFWGERDADVYVEAIKSWSGLD